MVNRQSGAKQNAFVFTIGNEIRLKTKNHDLHALRISDCNTLLNQYQKPHLNIKSTEFITILLSPEREICSLYE